MSSLHRGALAVALGAMSLGAHRAVLADERDPVVADALFREARELIKAQNYAEACPKLAESYRLEPAPGTLYNLAECEEKQGRLASSLQRWQSLVDLLTASKKLLDPRLPAARQKVESLTTRVPRLTLRLKAGSPPEAVVLRDGVELKGASLNASLPIEPGAHVVIVRSAYRRDGEYRFSAAESDRITLEVEPGPPDEMGPKPAASASASASAPPSAAPPPAAPPPAPSAAAPPAPSAEPPDDGARRTLAFVAGGVGLASLAGAVVTGLVINGKRDTVSSHCDAGSKLCDQQGLDAASSGKTLLPINLALWAVGVAGLGVSTYLFLTPSKTPVAGSLAVTREGAVVGATARF